MKTLYLFFGSMLLSAAVFAQTNILMTNAVADDIIHGNYDPANYASSQQTPDPHTLAEAINAAINPDSLKSYLIRMQDFKTRNTGSDTLSADTGIGAARRWAHHRFKLISEANEDRLQVGYLQFDQNICGIGQHRNVVAVLPGKGLFTVSASSNPLVIIEAHLDSRCEGTCNKTCVAQGMEDNASGSALVLELARVMSQFEYHQTIVFMLTTGEEQGLLGANAMATYLKSESIPVDAVLNNDVIGGIICGETSSAPSCPGLNHIDSTQVRMFSQGTFDSPHKQLARYIKLQYQEELLDHVKVPMQLTVMTAEDRTGRGGDHIPFRQQQYSAMRFTSANEHGNASNGPNYHDRQHTTDDILGVDTDGDSVIDSFFVDFNYLGRNAAINGVAAAMIAQPGCVPEWFDVVQTDWKTLRVENHNDWCQSDERRIALHTESNDWDTLITTFSDTTFIEVEPGHVYWVSLCRVNDDGVEDLFTREKFVEVVGIGETVKHTGIQLLQNRPNPFDESTSIAFIVHEMPADTEALISITDINGALIEQLRVPVKPGLNEVQYDHGYGQVGTFNYSLVIGGETIATKRMVFMAN